MHLSKESMPSRTAGYMTKVMIYTFVVGLAMNSVLAFILDILQPETLKQALSMSLLLALGVIGLRNFSDMLHTMLGNFWGIRSQKKFFVDTGYYVCMFALSTLVMYYVQTNLVS